MRKWLLVIAGLCTILLTFTNSKAVKRNVLCEMFTNVGCPPCRAADSTLDTLSEEWDGDSLVIIRYHVWWPGYDPMYNNNPTEIQVRNNYYNNNYTPHLFINGTTDGDANVPIWRVLISMQFNNPAILSLDLQGVVDSTHMKGKVTCTMTMVDDTFEMNADPKLRYALIQNNIYYVGSNGWPHHHQTFLDMFPSTAGVSVGRPGLGESVVDTEVFVIDPFVSPQHPVWSWDDLELVAFVQNDNDRYVYQAAKVGLLDLQVFACGDANGDGVITSLDMAFLAMYLFMGGPSPTPIEAADYNGDGILNALDIVHAATYFFGGGPEPVCLGN
jgi:thiol-disulfide isomerase/thioredoxin